MFPDRPHLEADLKVANAKLTRALQNEAAAFVTYCNLREERVLCEEIHTKLLYALRENPLSPHTSRH